MCKLYLVIKIVSGSYDIVVDYDGIAVPGSPFPVEVHEGCDSSKVKAYGPGLEKGKTNQPAKFTVDTRGAGTGGLGLAVEGPSDAKIVCTVEEIFLFKTCYCESEVLTDMLIIFKDGKDGTCQVEYFPTTPGDYEVNVTYGGDNIPGSPFVVPISDVVDPSKVEVDVYYDFRRISSNLHNFLGRLFVWALVFLKLSV